MRFFPATVAALLLTAPDLPAAEFGHEATVRFISGERLKGRITAFTLEDILLEAPLLLEPSRFPLDKIQDITLSPDAAASGAGHDTDVTLTNGDTIRGALVAITDQSVSLDTAFAGQVDFKRKMVANIGAVSPLRPRFRGPTGMDGWFTHGEPQPWTYADYALHARGPGGIGRADLLPDEVRVSFEVSWQGAALDFRIGLFADDTRLTETTAGYRITIRNNAMSINYMDDHIGSVPLPELARADHARIELCASCRSGMLKVTINDRPCDARIDLQAPQRNPGASLIFESLDGTPKELRSIMVRSWDGDAGRALVPASAEPGPGKRLELVNGDIVTGRITAINDGKVTVETAFGSFKLPARRFRIIPLNPGGGTAPRYQRGDVRGWFPDGSSIVFRLGEITPATLTCSGPAFGTARFKTSAFLRLEFNLDQSSKTLPDD